MVILIYLYVNSFLCIYIFPCAKKDLRCLRTTFIWFLKIKNDLVRVSGQIRVRKIRQIWCQHKGCLLPAWFCICAGFVWLRINLQSVSSWPKSYGPAEIFTFQRPRREKAALNSCSWKPYLGPHCNGWWPSLFWWGYCIWQPVYPSLITGETST